MGALDLLFAFFRYLQVLYDAASSFGDQIRIGWEAYSVPQNHFIRLVGFRSRNDAAFAFCDRIPVFKVGISAGK